MLWSSGRKRQEASLSGVFHREPSVHTETDFDVHLDDMTIGKDQPLTAAIPRRGIITIHQK
jgi:hypothetical protein